MAPRIVVGRGKATPREERGPSLGIGSQSTGSPVVNVHENSNNLLINVDHIFAYH
jgi:hypothetical protein